MGYPKQYSIYLRGTIGVHQALSVHGAADVQDLGVGGHTPGKEMT